MSTEKNILAIDSSTSILKVGLLPDDGKIVSAENRDKYRHAEFIFELIERVLQESGAEKSSITMITVCTGPGSFTGLRVGMSSAKGLATSLAVPIIGLSNYEMIAPRLFNEMGKCAVMVPSRRNEFYVGIIDSESFDNSNIMVARADELEEKTGGLPILLVDSIKDTLEIDNEIIGSNRFMITIEDLICAAKTKIMRKPNGDDINRLEPLYIQQFPVKPKK